MALNDDPIDAANEGLSKLKGYFFQNNMNDPRVNSELRNRMAVAMLSPKKNYPKTVGEGLTAIGDAIGDRAILSQLAQADIAKQQQGTSAVPDIVPQQAAPQAAPQASSALPPSVANANASVVPDQQPDEQPQPPPGPGMTVFDPNAARNRISTMLAGGGPQPNPTVGGSVEPQGSVASVTPTVLSDVSKAPDIPLRPGTQLAQAAPYVMPRPVEPMPPQQIPMTKREVDAVTAAQNYPNNEYVQQRAAAVIAQEKAVRDFQAAQNEKLFQSRLQAYQTQMAEYQKWLAGTDERALKRQEAPFSLEKMAADAAKARADAEAGKVPTTRDINGNVQQWDARTQSWITPPGTEPNLAPQLTETQSKNLDYYQRGKRALANLGSGSELNNFWDWYAGGMPLIGNKLSSTKFQEQYNAAKEFASIILRRESGAAVTPKELEDVIDRYIAKPGTSPETAVQKEFMRNGVISSLRDTLGKGSILADKFDQQFAAERAAQAAAQAAAAGRATGTLPTITMPDGSKQKLSADGTKWEPM